MRCTKTYTNGVNAVYKDVHNYRSKGMVIMVMVIMVIKIMVIMIVMGGVVCVHQMMMMMSTL